MSGARRHHYISRFYLEGFKRSATEKGLWVTDVHQGVQFPAVTKDIAVARDYNRVEIDGLEPNAVEDELSQVEAKAAAVIRRLVKSKVMPKGQDLADLMFFVALMHSRSPGYRKDWAEGFGRVANIAEKMMSVPEEIKRTWPPVISSSLSDSVGVPYEEFRKMIKHNDNGRVELHNEVYVDLMITAAKTVTPLLLQRFWTILVARKDAGDFICSDHPVSLTWTRKSLAQPFRSPGFGLQNTVVTVPINRRVALWGTWDRKQSVVTVDSKAVAVFNSRTAMYAEHLYSAGPDFQYVDPQDNVTSIQALLRQVRSKCRRSPEQ